MRRKQEREMKLLAIIGAMFCTVILAKFALKLLLGLVVIVFHLASILLPIVFILLIVWWVFKL